MQPHILNVYEDLSLTHADVLHMAEVLLTDGSELSVFEKLDGQNMTLKVDESGQLRFVGKGVVKWMLNKGGLSIAEVGEHYAKWPAVADAYTRSMVALQEMIDSDEEWRKFLIDRCNRFARHGKPELDAFAAEVVLSSNPNVIRYPRDMVSLLDVFCPRAFTASNGITVSGIQELDHVRPDPEGLRLFREMYAEVAMLGNTIGEACMDLVISNLAHHGVRGELMVRAAARLVHDDPSILPHREFGSPAAWKAFKALDDDRETFVVECIRPIEKCIQFLGSRVMGCYGFKETRWEDGMLDYIAAGTFNASEETDRKIGATLRRYDPEMPQHDGEGVVFLFPVGDGTFHLLKLTGAFTVVNKLLSFFRYGSPPPARLI